MVIQCKHFLEMCRFEIFEQTETHTTIYTHSRPQTKSGNCVKKRNQKELNEMEKYLIRNKQTTVGLCFARKFVFSFSFLYVYV
jgi:hypothetical protein